MKVLLIPKPCVPYGLNDTAEFKRSHSRTGQKGGEEKMVSGADNNGVKQLLIDMSQHAIATPPGPKNNQSLPHGVAAPNPGREPPPQKDVHILVVAAFCIMNRNFPSSLQALEN